MSFVPVAVDGCDFGDVASCGAVGIEFCILVLRVVGIVAWCGVGGGSRFWCGWVSVAVAF